MPGEPGALEAARRAAAEFRLGEIRDIAVVQQGTSPCFRVAAASGVFAVKREVSDAVELAAEVADRLDAQGYPQAVFRRTGDGSPLTSEGFTATRWLPGTARSRPEPEESAPLMRALSRYQELLAPIKVPVELRQHRTLWTRLASVDHLLGDLYEECRAVPVAAPAVEAAASLLRRHREAIGSLPMQLIHGDLGGDNILFSPDRILFIDFTPHWDAHLAGLGASLYWSHVSATDGVPDTVHGGGRRRLRLAARLRQGRAGSGPGDGRQGGLPARRHRDPPRLVRGRGPQGGLGAAPSVPSRPHHRVAVRHGERGT